MKFETEKFKQKKLSLAALSLRSKNFYEFIKKRRSIREFDKTQIEDGIIFKSWFFVIRFVAPVMVAMVLLYFFI